MRIPSRLCALPAAAFAAAVLATAPAADAHGVFPCHLRHPSDDSLEWDCYRLDHGETLETLFPERWADVARFNRIDRRHVYEGVEIKIPQRLDAIACFSPLPKNYAPGEAELKLILVDLSEQFLGAYEFGEIAFSLPIASGQRSNPTPSGDFRVTAFHRDHRSSLYYIEGTRRPYPMRYGLRFHTTSRGVTYWIHGRDLPGYPASHGCIGLYDEAMQAECYGRPEQPELADARRLYEWVVGDLADSGRLQVIEGPQVRIIGQAPSIAR